MKKTIDTLESLTGWSFSNVTGSVQTWPNFIADFLSGSLLFDFTVAGATATKTFSPAIDVSDMVHLALSIASNQRNLPEAESDYRLKIKFSDGTPANDKEYYLPENGQFAHVQFLNTFQTISSVTITAVSPVKIFISDLISYKDDFPFDIYQAVMQILRTKLDSLPQILVGQVTASPGDTEVTISNSRYYLDKYACIKIGNEIHQVVSDVTEGVVSFGQLFDGGSILNSYTNEPVYLYIPLSESDPEHDAFIPGISVSEAWNGEVVGHDRNSYIVDSWNVTDETVRVREFNTTYQVRVLIEGMSRHSEIDEYLMKAIKKSFNDKTLVYINGRAIEAHTSGVEYVDYGDADEILSKIQLHVEFTIQEDTDEWEIQPINFNLQTTVAVQN